MPIRCAASLLILLALTGCGREPAQTNGGADYDPGRDYFSFANTDQFESRHLELDLDVDFERRTLSGHVIHGMACLDPGASRIVLDSRGLVIGRVQAASAAGMARELNFRLGETDPVRGEALRIDLPDDFDFVEYESVWSYRWAPEQRVRIDGQRVLRITANVEPKLANANQVQRELQAEVLPQLLTEGRVLQALARSVSTANQGA